MSAEKPMQNLLSDEWNEGMDWGAFVAFSTKNVERMRENYANTEIPAELADEIKGLKSEIRILAIGADWCGDAVANLPSIARLAALNGKIQFRVVDRDRHEELMNQFLTNGGKAIPKVILAPANMARHAAWGPRPGPCQAIMDTNKGKMPKEEIIPLMREWYKQDANRTLLAEISAHIRAMAA